MNKATILIISENNNRTSTLVDKFDKSFYTLTADGEETAIDRFLQSPVNAVLFGEDITDSVKTKLTKLFSAQQPGCTFITDDPARNMVDVVTKQISQAQQENKPSFAFRDDALKNAGLHIDIQ